MDLKILMLFLFTHHNYVLSTSTNITGQGKDPPSLSWRILFFGSDDFSLRTLVLLTKEFKESKKLISKLEVMFIDDETVVWKHAYEHRLPRTAYTADIGEELRGKYDIGILVSFGKLLHDNLMSELPLGILNAHPSLLPRWRGAAPISHAIMNGDIETGVSIMRIKANEFDTGEIVKQTRTKIGPHEHTPELSDRLAEESANLVMDILKGLPKSIQNTVPQSDEKATYAPKLKQEMSWIVWQNMSSENIYNRHRAISHIWPVTTIWKSYVVKFHDMKISSPSVGTATESQTKTRLHNLQANECHERLPPRGNTGPGAWLKPGLVMYDKGLKSLRVMCCDGAQLLVPRVTVSGKKTMNALSFHNGFLSRVKSEERIFSEYSHFKGTDATSSP